MGTPLDEIFDRFYSLIKDTDLAKLDNEDLYKLTKVYYEMASTRFKECKNNLELVQDEEGNYYTTDKLTVNGDTELNGAVKAGSITIGDGSITAGEVCIGAKGIVIDKDKNAAFADISSSNITAENIEVNTKI